jgi:uncharacterized membrane protein
MPRALLGATFLTNGLLHFLRPRMYEAIMPRYLPAHRELVYASGVAEIAGGAGVLYPRTAKPAGWWLIATLIAIFPANVEMAVHAERFRKIPRALLWARLPIQGLLIAWVWKSAAR